VAGQIGKAVQPERGAGLKTMPEWSVSHRDGATPRLVARPH
jgi:hypothetical protein